MTDWLLTSQFAKDTWSDLVRHALTGAAIWLVAHGYMSQDQTNSFIGAGFFLAVTLGWQVWENYNQHQKRQANVGALEFYKNQAVALNAENQAMKTPQQPPVASK